MFFKANEIWDAGVSDGVGLAMSEIFSNVYLYFMIFSLV